MVSKGLRLLGNGRNQAVRIPVEFELPMCKRGLLGLLTTMEPLNEDFPDIEDRPPWSPVSPEPSSTWND